MCISISYNKSLSVEATYQKNSQVKIQLREALVVWRPSDYQDKE